MYGWIENICIAHRRHCQQVSHIMAKTLLNLIEKEFFTLKSYHSQNLIKYNFKSKRVYASI